jgi:glycosyltransferase involved in cell wall biosynthesis
MIEQILNGSWVVIPAYNEAGAVRSVVSAVRQLVPRVAVVDDGSSDSTAAEALAAGAIVIRHAVNLGQGAALATGIRYALDQGAGHIFTFDADGQHDAGSLPVLADTLARTGADVVLGSRTLGRAEGIPTARKLMLRSAVAFTRVHCGLRVSDTHNGLRLFTRHAASLIRISQPRMAHASEILAQIHSLGLRFAEAPVTVRYTEYSLRKGQSIWAAFGILLDLWRPDWIK